MDPEGASVGIAFQFGPTSAYGQSTPAQTLGPANAVDGFTSALSGLAAGTTIHYRAVATTDFGTFVGADQSFTTPVPQSPPSPKPGVASVGRATVKGSAVTVTITCTGSTSCGSRCA